MNSAGYGPITAELATNFHVSISYLFCISSQYQDKMAQLLRAYKWKTLTAHFDHVCCDWDPGDKLMLFAFISLNFDLIMITQLCICDSVLFSWLFWYVSQVLST